MQNPSTAAAAGAGASLGIEMGVLYTGGELTRRQPALDARE
jgi:hypothetical protein